MSLMKVLSDTMLCYASYLGYPDHIKNETLPLTIKVTGVIYYLGQQTLNKIAIFFNLSCLSLVNTEYIIFLSGSEVCYMG